jgi:hypothetical protein
MGRDGTHPPLGKEVARETRTYGVGTSVGYGSIGSAWCSGGPPEWLLLSVRLGAGSVLLPALEEGLRTSSGERPDGA